MSLPLWFVILYLVLVGVVAAGLGIVCRRAWRDRRRRLSTGGDNVGIFPVLFRELFCWYPLTVAATATMLVVSAQPKGNPVQKTWLAEGITDENGPTARTLGAHIIGRAFAHEYDATGDLITIADFGLGLTFPQYEIAIRAGLELLEG